MSIPVTPVSSAPIWQRTAPFRAALPTMAYLRQRARRRIPGFAYDFLEGGTGEGIAPARNRAAFDAMEMAWRVFERPAADFGCTIFGQSYSAPLGIAPVGMDGAIWPGAALGLAAAASRVGIPYIAGTLACAALETIAQACPDRFWFQLYGFPANNHAITFDLVRRAREAGAKVLVATMDVPGHAKRTLDLVNGITVPFRPTPAIVAAAALKPAWSLALLRHGAPGCPTMAPYVGGMTSLTEISRFVRANVTGSFTAEDVRSLRRAWDGPLVLKGVLTPDDARRAADLGADGLIVSNHGGRQSDASPATLDVLPAIVDSLAGRLPVMIDGGIRSGLDIAKAVAAGADFAFAGRSFLTGMAALGETGGHYVADLLIEEFGAALTQSGVTRPEALRGVPHRHPGRWDFPSLG